MEFKKLDGCDSSDMGLWANHIAASNFVKVVTGMRDKALREAIKAKNPNRDESAAVARAWNHVLGLFEEAREMK